MNRRQFLLTTSGVAAGFILPSFFDKALDFAEQFGEPLIVKPNVVTKVLFAYEQGSGDLQFNLGDPWEEPAPMTYREFIGRYWLVDPDEVRDFPLDEEIPYNEMTDMWCRVDSPNAKAYRLLEGYDLGPNFTSPDAVGELKFIDGPSPGNDYLGVEAEDLVSVSLLQERLNQLKTGIHIQIWEDA